VRSGGQTPEESDTTVGGSFVDYFKRPVSLKSAFAAGGLELNLGMMGSASTRRLSLQDIRMTRALTLQVTVWCSHVLVVKTLNYCMCRCVPFYVYTYVLWSLVYCFLSSFCYIIFNTWVLLLLTVVLHPCTVNTTSLFFRSEYFARSEV
jgi:hypothetical protein